MRARDGPRSWFAGACGSSHGTCGSQHSSCSAWASAWVTSWGGACRSAGRATRSTITSGPTCSPTATGFSTPSPWPSRSGRCRRGSPARLHRLPGRGVGGWLPELLRASGVVVHPGCRHCGRCRVRRQAHRWEPSRPDRRGPGRGAPDIVDAGRLGAVGDHGDLRDGARHPCRLTMLGRCPAGQCDLARYRHRDRRPEQVGAADTEPARRAAVVLVPPGVGAAAGRVGPGGIRRHGDRDRPVGWVQPRPVRRRDCAALQQPRPDDGSELVRRWLLRPHRRLQVLSVPRSRHRG